MNKRKYSIQRNPFTKKNKVEAGNNPISYFFFFSQTKSFHRKKNNQEKLSINLILFDLKIYQCGPFGKEDNIEI